MSDLEQKKKDILRARAWAKEHWPVYVDEESTPSHLLASQRYIIDFPDVDRMTIYLASYGEAAIMSEMKFRLAWLPGGIAWVGGLSLRPDLVVEMYIDKETEKEAG